MDTSVLLVESDADLRLAIAATLEGAHCHCDAVSNGADALLKLRASDYTYILLDFDAPLPMLALRRALANEPALMEKVILICETPEAPEGMSRQRLLRKPFDRSELLATVQG